MANLAALYDASVLYPAPLRDLLMQLALSDLYRAHWTNDIHDEWIRNVLGNRPDLTPEQLDRTRALMNASVRDCLVENYRELIPALDLPDLDDRHVLAAAIVANANVIVTFNLRDFPRENLEKYGIEAQHPDEFIAHLIELAPSSVISGVSSVRARLQNPPLSASTSTLSSDSDYRILQQRCEILRIKSRDIWYARRPARIHLICWL